MNKRKRYAWDVAKDFKRSKRRRIDPPGRNTYRTVPRTRGAYATGEMKYLDQFKAETSIALVTTTWVAGTIFDPATTNCLFAPTVGASISQRIGREVKVHKIKVRGTFVAATQAAVTGGDNGSLVRFIVVMDKQTNATQMTGAQLLADNSAAITTIHAFQNLDNLGRFRVLKDKMYKFDNPNLAFNGTNMTQEGLYRHFKFTIKFKKPISVHFNATGGGTVADIVDNSFHVVCGTDNNALNMTCAYTARVSYKE